MLDIDDVFAVSTAIRYVAVYAGDELLSRQRPDLENTSASDSDRYEELFVNPALLTLATQRGNLDCGGLGFLVVGYGHFHQVVLPMAQGHLSVCVEQNADPVSIARRLAALVKLGTAIGP